MSESVLFKTILDDKLACIAAGIGDEMGEFMRCMITTEIASLTDERELIDKKITRLHAILTGDIDCNKTI